MAGVTSVPFRELCRRYGADAVVTEMISANALVHNNKATLKLLNHSEEERPVGVQLFGGKTEFILGAAKLVKNDFDFIDLNFGCPAKKIIKQGAGAALLKRKNRIKEIVEAVSGLNVPLSVKIRSGIDKQHINAIEIAEICEEAGANAIFIHARTISQGYSGKADWNVIKAVKENVKIPVIGNGDIFNPIDALRMYQETKCDSLMIGRGALGNPFIFREIKSLVDKGKEMQPATLGERIKAFLSIQQRLNFNEAKAHALYFLKDFRDCSKLRLQLSTIKEREELIEALDKISNLK